MPKFEPARWYAIAVAAIALLAYYVTIPEALLVGLVGAILLGGEGVRNAVTPNVKFEQNDGDET